MKLGENPAGHNRRAEKPNEEGSIQTLPPDREPSLAGSSNVARGPSSLFHTAYAAERAASRGRLAVRCLRD